jgi:uncharacterized protein YbjT (DUF2867 family)
MKTAVIAGHSGLIGRQLLDLLLGDEHYTKVIALGRKSLDIENHKLVQKIVDFNEINFDAEHVDDVFCCLGTTIKKAGTKEKFRLVDFQFPVNLANVCYKKGATTFSLVSSMGASENSNVFYSKVKGEVEKAINNIGFHRVEIYRPSLLLGDRNESRFGEDFGKGFMKGLGFLFVGPLKNYKAIDSLKVATAMISIAKDKGSGNHIHFSGELQDF